MSDLDRLRKEYSKRQSQSDIHNRYSLKNPSYRFMLTNRHRSLINLITHQGLTSFEGKKLLEIGCGSGGVLKEFLGLSIIPENLFGIDLLFTRLLEAHNVFPTSGILNSDAQDLPFSECSFDIVLQYTAFSSVLDLEIKKRMATEMLRVLDQNGVIIWYDFWWNPTNPQTRGIHTKEIRELFPNCTFYVKKITLAPPISRILVPISEKFASSVEKLELFNSHFLAIISKAENQTFGF